MFTVNVYSADPSFVVEVSLAKAFIIVVPFPLIVTTPSSLTVATAVSDELHSITASVSLTNVGNTASFEVTVTSVADVSSSKNPNGTFVLGIF